MLVSTAALYDVVSFFSSEPVIVVGSDLWRHILNPVVWPSIRYLACVDKPRWGSRVVLWEVRDGTWQQAPAILQQKTLFALLRHCRVTIDLRSESLRFAWQAWLARVPIRVGGSPSILNRLFFTHFTHEPSPQRQHERDRYLDLVASLDKEYFAAKRSHWHTQGLALLQPNLPSPASNQKPLIVVNPTASIREKAWPSAYFAQLVEALNKERFDVVVVGAPHETAWLQQVSGKTCPIIQPNTIAELVYTIAKASLLVTNTSSVQFIAATTHTPTLTLMGQAKPEIWGPLGPRSAFLKAPHLDIPQTAFTNLDEIYKEAEIAAYRRISVPMVLHWIETFFSESLC